MMKSITAKSLLFLSVLILLSFAYRNPANAYQKNSTLASDCIQTVIAMDDSLGTIRNHACEKISLSQTIQQYVAGMESLDFRNCPQTFTNAFSRHIAAWKDMVSITDQHSHLRGEMHDLFDEIKKGTDAEGFSKKLKAIWDTWGEVEQAMKK